MKIKRRWISVNTYFNFIRNINPLCFLILLCVIVNYILMSKFTPTHISQKVAKKCTQKVETIDWFNWLTLQTSQLNRSSTFFYIFQNN